MLNSHTVSSGQQCQNVRVLQIALYECLFGRRVFSFKPSQGFALYTVSRLMAVSLYILIYMLYVLFRERMSRLLLPFADQQVEISSLSAGNIALTVGLKQVYKNTYLLSQHCPTKSHNPFWQQTNSTVTTNTML